MSRFHVPRNHGNVEIPCGHVCSRFAHAVWCSFYVLRVPFGVLDVLFWSTFHTAHACSRLLTVWDLKREMNLDLTTRSFWGPRPQKVYTWPVDCRCRIRSFWGRGLQKSLGPYKVRPWTYRGLLFIIPFWNSGFCHRIILVLVVGGRDCLLGDYMLPTTFYKNIWFIW